MRVASRRCACRTRSRRAARPLVLAVAAVLVPAGAPAGQSSQATATPFAQVAAGLYHSCALVDAGTLPAPASRPVRCWGFSGDGQVGYGNTTSSATTRHPRPRGRSTSARGAPRRRSRPATTTTARCSTTAACAAGATATRASSATAAGPRRRQRDPRLVAPVRPRRRPHRDGDHRRRQPHLRAARQRQRALLGPRRVRPARLRQPRRRSATASRCDSVGPVNLDGHTPRRSPPGSATRCAILDDGNVRCWGLGGNGQLGYANTRAVLKPASSAGRPRRGTARPRRSRPATRTPCALLDDGSVRCWGSTGRPARLRQHDLDRRQRVAGNRRPVNLGAGRTAMAISAGGDHTCAMLDNGSVRCWGSGHFGQLGYGNSVEHIGDNETPGSRRPVDLGAGTHRHRGRRGHLPHVRAAGRRRACAAGARRQRPARALRPRATSATTRCRPRRTGRHRLRRRRLPVAPPAAARATAASPAAAAPGRDRDPAAPVGAGRAAALAAGASGRGAAPAARTCVAPARSERRRARGATARGPHARALALRRERAAQRRDAPAARRASAARPGASRRSPRRPPRTARSC